MRRLEDSGLVSSFRWKPDGNPVSSGENVKRAVQRGLLVLVAICIASLSSQAGSPCPSGVSNKNEPRIEFLEVLFRTGPTGDIGNIAWFPDGSRLLIEQRTGRSILDLQSMKINAIDPEPNTPKGLVGLIAISPNQKFVAFSPAVFGWLQILDAETFRTVAVRRNPTAGHRCVKHGIVFSQSSDALWMICASNAEGHDYPLALGFATTDLQPVGPLGVHLGDDAKYFRGGHSIVAYTPSGPKLIGLVRVSATEPEPDKRWNISHHALIVVDPPASAATERHDAHVTRLSSASFGFVHHMALSADSQRLLIAGQDGARDGIRWHGFELHDLSRAGAVSWYELPRDLPYRVSGVAFSPSSRLLYYSMNNWPGRAAAGALAISDDAGNVLYRCDFPEAYQVKNSPDSKYLAVNYYNELRIFRITEP